MCCSSSLVPRKNSSAERGSRRRMRPRSSRGPRPPRRGSRDARFASAERREPERHQRQLERAQVVPAEREVRGQVRRACKEGLAADRRAPALELLGRLRATASRSASSCAKSASGPATSARGPGGTSSAASPTASVHRLEPLAHGLRARTGSIASMGLAGTPRVATRTCSIRLPACVVSHMSSLLSHQANPSRRVVTSVSSRSRHRKNP